MVQSWTRSAEELQPQRWPQLQSVDGRLHPVVSQLHVPFIAQLCEEIEYEDTCLAYRCLHGFPFVGIF